MKRPGFVERQPRRPEGVERTWLGERQLTDDHHGNLWAITIKGTLE
jgi:hypothetical protein